MEDADARFELAVYVPQEHVEKFRALLNENVEGNLLGDIEKAIGRRMYEYPPLREGSFGGEMYDYGSGVAEVYVEGGED